MVSLIYLRWIVIYLAPFVQKVDSAIHWINLYPLKSGFGFPDTYLLDSDLSSGQRYPTFEQLGMVDSSIQRLNNHGQVSRLRV